MADLFLGGKFQALDSNGAPLSSGKLYTYAAGGLTPLATYTDQAGGTPNANPVVLDSAGRADVWLGSAYYRMILKTSAGVTVYDEDNIGAGSWFIQSGTGAITRTAQSKMRETVSVTDFGADPTGVADSTAAIQAALTSLSATGGTVTLPPGTFKISSVLTCPTYVSLRGAGMWATYIQQTGAAFAIKIGADACVSDLSLRGSASATGGIDYSNVGLSETTRVDIENFTATGAIALKFNETYRAKVDLCYVYNCYIGLQCTGAVTTSSISNTEFAVISTYAIYCGGGSGYSSELYFTKCYFESCAANNPIYNDQTSTVKFENCGFEAMTSGASPKLMWFKNPARLYVKNCQWSGFNSSTYSYSGIAYVFYMDADAPLVSIDGLICIQNYSIAGYTPYLLRSLGVYGIVSLKDVYVLSGIWASALEAERFMLGGIDPTYTPKTSIVNCRAVGTIINKTPPMDVNAAVVTATAANQSVYSRTYPKQAFGPGCAIRIKAWGKRTGVGGTKRALLQLTAGASVNSFLMSDSVSTATDWHGECVIDFISYTDLRLGITAFGAAAVAIQSTNTAKDTSANDLVVQILLDVQVGGDTMTLDGLVVERM